jgi:hypothetical protein
MTTWPEGAVPLDLSFGSAVYITLYLAVSVLRFERCGTSIAAEVVTRLDSLRDDALDESTS